LVPYVLAYYHLQGHSGAKKLYIAIRKWFYWSSMRADCAVFAKGCILCSIYKHDNKGKAIIGMPLKFPDQDRDFK
jgi:hypothetical protein